MNEFDIVLNKLPYKKPFLFVDKLLELNENGAKGQYTLKKDEYFYAGHFPEKPITPGVIVTEIMSQIGLVCLGIHLLNTNNNAQESILPVFSSANVEFLSPVLPGDTLIVQSEKIYFRFNKLKSKISCLNAATRTEICRGEFSGMIITVDEFQ